MLVHRNCLGHFVCNGHYEHKRNKIYFCVGRRQDGMLCLVELDMLSRTARASCSICCILCTSLVQHLFHWKDVPFGYIIGKIHFYIDALGEENACSIFHMPIVNSVVLPCCCKLKWYRVDIHHKEQLSWYSE